MIPQYQGEGAGARESPSQYTYLPYCKVPSYCMYAAGYRERGRVQLPTYLLMHYVLHYIRR